MTNCNITIQIIGCESKNNQIIPFNDLICIFQMDNYEGTINIGQYKFQKIHHQIKNIKNDLKYNIKVFNYKEMTNLGLSFIIIPYSLIKNSNIFSNNEIKKKCLISITDSKINNNYFNYHTKENEFILSINIKFEVLSKTNLSKKKNNMSQGFFKRNNINLHNTFSPKNDFIKELKNEFNHTPYINNKIKPKLNDKNIPIKTYSNIPLSSYRTYRSCIENKKKDKLTKNNYYRLRIGKENLLQSKSKCKSLINESDIFLNTSPTIIKYKPVSNGKIMNSASDLRNPLNENSKNLSMIEQNVFDNNYVETEDNSEKINKDIYSNLNNNSFRDSINKKKIKEKIENLIDFHSLLVVKVNSLINKKKDLVNLLILNLERLKLIKKQKNKLNQLNLNLKSTNIKVNINLRTKKSIYTTQSLIHKKEFNIFQNIINSHYYEYDILDSLKSKNLDDKNNINLLLNCIKGCIFSFGNISDIYDQQEDLKIKFKSLLFRYNIRENDEIYTPIVKDNVIILRTSIKKNYEIEPIIAIKEVDEEKEDDSDDSYNSYNEKKIDNKIKEIENKKLSNIKFNKISHNLFQFGSKKIRLKIENSEVKVELSKNKSMKIEEFIEQNKKTEEMLQNKKEIVKYI